MHGAKPIGPAAGESRRGQFQRSVLARRPLALLRQPGVPQSRHTRLLGLGFRSAHGRRITL